MARKLFTGTVALWLIAGCSAAKRSELSSAPAPQRSEAPLRSAIAEPETEILQSTKTRETQPQGHRTSSARLPTSVVELAERGIGAIRSGNVEAYLEVFVTNEAVRQYCPELLEKLGPRAQEASGFIRSDIAKCGKVIDWSKAREINRAVQTGGKRVPFSCKDHNEVYEMDEILFEFEVLGERFSINLDRPMRIGPVYVLADDPECRRVIRE